MNIDKYAGLELLRNAVNVFMHSLLTSMRNSFTMRTRDNEPGLSSSRMRHGRAMLLGMGLDDSGGHIRYTSGDSYELYGGSESAHGEMQRRIIRIQKEITRMGFSLDRMTYEQYETLKVIVDRVNCGEF